MKIRHMQPGDIAAVQEAACRTWAHTYDGIIPEEVQKKFLDRAYSDASLARRMESDIFLVAEDAGEVVGFADFQSVSKAAAYLGALYVLPDHQRLGIGTRLFETGLTEFPPSVGITLRVERHNARARRFYEAHGFRITGETTEDLFGHESHEIEMIRDPRKTP
ncbi:MAG: GNAT family N-acetyltransferase [Actinomycetota bacterium]|nr:GNAT family N-acetyltransferase [Actinomycetota bacterium]